MSKQFEINQKLNKYAKLYRLNEKFAYDVSKKEYNKYKNNRIKLICKFLNEFWNLKDDITNILEYYAIDILYELTDTIGEYNYLSRIGLHIQEIEYFEHLIMYNHKVVNNNFNDIFYKVLDVFYTELTEDIINHLINCKIFEISGMINYISDIYRENILFIACRYKYYNWIKYIIELGINLDIKNENEKTALHIILNDENVDIDIVKLFFENKIGSQVKYNATYLTIDHKNKNVAKYLLQKHIDLLD